MAGVRRGSRLRTVSHAAHLGKTSCRIPSRGQAKEGKDTRHTMDEATKAGYGVLLMRQALPKSQFYARTTANIRAGLQEPAPAPADTIPFGVLGRGPTRKPLDLAKDAHVKALAKRLDELHGATAKPQRGNAAVGATVSMKPR